jgi:hypothetical protein
MTLMRGSFLCNAINQGFSETWHSSNPSDNYASMKKKMANIAQPRAYCTNTSSQPPPNGNLNLVTFQFWRISDDLLQRDVQVTATPTLQGYNGSAGNLDAQLAMKVVWRNAVGSQIAVTYFHGVPIGFITGSNTRNAVFNGNGRTNLTAYCAAVAGQGLGFNTLNLAPANAMGPITAVAYNAVSGNYTFTMTNPVPQGKFRVRISQMKSLRYLNGRWPAQSTGANTFVLVRPAQAFTWDNFGTALPLSGYNNNVPFSNYIVVVPATCEPTLLIARKLGRPFYLQHGRVSRKAAA